MGGTEASVFGEAGQVEVVRSDLEAGGDVVLDAVQPDLLLTGVNRAAISLQCEPGLVAIFDDVREWDQVAVGVDGSVDKRDEVGQDPLAGTADLGGVEGLVGGPEALGVPVMRWPDC